MSKVTINTSIPNFSLSATNNQTIKLSDLLGKNIVLYFYPKDCTSGCTLEGQNFRDHYAEFKKFNTEIFGLSRDTIKLHEKFKSEQNFPFELLSDADEKICNLFDVLKEKNMYGKKVIGIQRSTFLINPKGVLIHEWRNVKVDGHVEEVLAKIKGL
jgi:peroxiredoxin Q/BCP